jgi:hypothetical protein
LNSAKISKFSDKTKTKTKLEINKTKNGEIFAELFTQNEISKKIV